MSHGQFFVTSTNPNDTMGGRGCVCSPEHQIDCTAPFIVIPGNEMESVVSPHVVVCAKCVHRMSNILEGEILDSGEKCSGAGVANGYDFEIGEDGLPKV